MLQVPAIIKEITEKEQSVKLFFDGYFGNKVRQWDSLPNLEKDTFKDHIVIRQRRRGHGGRGITIYDVPKCAVRGVVNKLIGRGVPETTLYFNEAIKPTKVVFQGEVARGIKGLYLLYSTYPHHMHVALTRRPEHSSGLRAKLLMEKYVCEQGLQCIWDLLDRFEDHVVEFTTCSEVFGSLMWRTVVWECRKF